MLEVLLVTIGAAVGAPLRFLTAHWVRERLEGTAMGGTLLVNVLGSGLLGLILGADLGRPWVALLGVGFCGAYTTFSAFALELLDALREQRIRILISTLLLSLLLGIGAFSLLFWVGGSL